MRVDKATVSHRSNNRKLLRDSCCASIDELQQKMKNREEWSKISHSNS